MTWMLLGWLGCSGQDACVDPTCPNRDAQVEGADFDEALHEAQETAPTSSVDWSVVTYECVTPDGTTYDVIESGGDFGGSRSWYDPTTGELVATSVESDVDEYCCDTSNRLDQGPIPESCARRGPSP